MTVAQRAMLNELLDVESGLTPWEVEFIDDLDRKDRATLAGVGITLTGKQASTLGRIHADRVVRGHVHIDTDGPQMDGPQMDGPQMDGAEKDGAEKDGDEMDGAEDQ